MKPTKIFYGEPESGKSRKAREIAKGRNCLYLDGITKKQINSRFCFSRVTPQTDLIIIDGIPNKFDFELFYGFISCDRFYYEVQRKGVQSIPTPEFILITNEKPKKSDKASFKRRFELIEFKK